MWAIVEANLKRLEIILGCRLVSWKLISPLPPVTQEELFVFISVTLRRPCSRPFFLLCTLKKFDSIQWITIYNQPYLIRAWFGHFQGSIQLFLCFINTLNMVIDHPSVTSFTLNSCNSTYPYIKYFKFKNHFLIFSLYSNDNIRDIKAGEYGCMDCALEMHPTPELYLHREPL